MNKRKIVKKPINIEINSTKERTRDLVPGDGILVDGKAWISRQIKRFEDFARKRMGMKPRKLYSHVAMVIYVLPDMNTIGVAEAQAKGIIITRYNNYYNHPSIKYIERIEELTEDEKKKISEIAYQAVEKTTRYDFLGILYQMWYTITGKWKGKTGEQAEKRLYCSEAFATWHDEIQKGIFEDPEAVNPLDVDLNPNFKAKEYQKFGKDGKELK